MGKCSHCGVVGHNYVRCPLLSTEQIKEIKEKKKKEKEERDARRLQRQQMQGIQQGQGSPGQEHLQPSVDLKLEIINTTDFELACYFKVDDQRLKRFVYVPSHTNIPFTCKKETYIEIYPTMEIIGPNGGIEPDKYISINNTYTKFFGHIMGDYDGETIIIDQDYNPPKTELEEWKEVALKSHYLLKQIESMSSEKKDGKLFINKNYDPISPFIDMIQDIVIPQNCSEYDKERAGIPSSLTNIT